MFWSLSWADSQLERISVDYDRAVLMIRHDSGACYNLYLDGFLGLTDLCLWEDSIIHQMNLETISLETLPHRPEPFLQQVWSAWSENLKEPWCKKSLSQGILCLSIHLVSGFVCRLYGGALKVETCQTQEDPT